MVRLRSPQGSAATRATPDKSPLSGISYSVSLRVGWHEGQFNIKTRVSYEITLRE